MAISLQSQGGISPSDTIQQLYCYTSGGTSAMGYPTLNTLLYYEVIIPSDGYYKFQSCGNVGGGGAYSRIGLMYTNPPTESTVYYPTQIADGETGIGGEFAMVNYFTTGTMRYLAITSTYTYSQSNDKFQFNKCYKVKLQPNNSAWGGVTISNSGGDTEFYCFKGETIKLSAGPNSGYKFVQWVDSAGNTVSTDATFSFTKNNAYDETFTAQFAPSTPLNIFIQRSPNDGGTTYVNGNDVNSSVTGNYLDSITLYAVPSTNYTFNYWTIDGSIVSYSQTHSFTLQDNVTCVAYFTYNAPTTTTTYTIQFNGNGHTGGSLPPTKSQAGTSTSVTMGDISGSVPTKTGYIFRGWSSTSSYSSKRIAYTTSAGGEADRNNVSATITGSSWTYQNYCTYTGYTGTSTTLTLYAQWEADTTATTYKIGRAHV